MTKLRRIVVGAAAGPVAAVMLVVSMGLGSSLPGARLLPSVPALAGLDYSAGALAQVAPLRDEFLRESLGRHLLGRFVAGSLGTVPPTVGPGREGDGDDRPRGDDGDHPIQDILQPPTLTIAMSADRETVRPGEDITYTYTVRNVGDRRFTGGLRVESHHPYGTTDSTPGSCEIQDAGNPCEPVLVPVPGTPDEDVHSVSYTTSNLAAGEERSFQVRMRVNPGTQPGTEITNHAHLIANEDRTKTKTAPPVVVVVVE